MDSWNLRPLFFSARDYRAPLKIHFGEQANLFDSGLRQEKTAQASTKADFPSLPECKNLLLVAQKQLLELPLTYCYSIGLFCQMFNWKITTVNIIWQLATGFGYGFRKYPHQDRPQHYHANADIL